MKPGFLYYNELERRYCIGDEGVHCGDLIDINLKDGSWKTLRMEYDWENKTWFLCDNTGYCLTELDWKVAKFTR